MILSIVVPMYNVELYIEECLLSCIQQDIPHCNYEIIVINDGSMDYSLKIAEDIASRFDNIKIYSQPNSGLSVARNVGLQYARGKYVWFVDSDDRIRENCLSQIVDQCEKENLDILAIAAANIVKDKEIRRFQYVDHKVVFGVEALEKVVMQHCVPFSIYRREFLLKYELIFFPGIFHEDLEFSPRSYFYAKRIGFTNEIFYLVNINPNSITRSINYKKSFDLLQVAISIHHFQEKILIKNRFFHDHISLVINNALSNFIKSTNDKEQQFKAMKKFCKELYENRHLFMHLRKSSKLKYKTEGYLFTLFPSNAMLIYRSLNILKFK